MKPIPTETATDVGSVGKWLGAAAAGALLMYLLDPERGSARRSRAASPLGSGAPRPGRGTPTRASRCVARSPSGCRAT